MKSQKCSEAVWNPKILNIHYEYLWITTLWTMFSYVSDTMTWASGKLHILRSTSRHPSVEISNPLDGWPCGLWHLIQDWSQLCCAMLCNCEPIVLAERETQKPVLVWKNEMVQFTVHEHLIYRNLLKLDLQFQDVKQRNLWPNSKGPCCLTRIMSPQVAENTSISLTGTWEKHACRVRMNISKLF